MELNELKDKKILILGFGREGRDTFFFLRKMFPKKVLGIADKQKISKLKSQISKPQLKSQNFKNIKWHTGEGYLNALKDYSVVMKSPGIPPKVIAPFITQKQRVTSQTEIFFNNCPGKIIGITGTKGKSTATSLTYKVLKDGGVRAHLVGNIGKPVLNLLFSATPNDVYVYELSSHQLYNLKKSPHIAVFLNIYPEHLDYYKNFQEYFRAKQNITLHQKQNDYFIFNASEKLVGETAKKTKATKISFGLKNADCSIKNNYIVYKGEKITALKDIPLKGEFNYLNVMPSIIIGKLFGISLKNIIKSIKTFIPLEHRLELVGTYKGITFYNDALATIPQATIAAIDALGNNVQTIILGGFDRNIDFKELAKRVLNSKIKNVILFPTTGKKIWQAIIKVSKNRKLPRPFPVDNMKDAIKLAYQHTKKGKICLLSCASSSFSIFRDYKEKGNLFKLYVKKFAVSH